MIIAKGEIDYPKVMVPDLLLCMSQEACDKFYSQVKDDGWIIVDSTNVSRVPSHRAFAVPLSEIAERITGRRITASMVALGLVCGMSGLVTWESLTKAMSARVPAGTEEINAKALAAGFEEAARLREQGAG